MREFRVTLNHKAGELARLTQLLSDEHINLKSVAGVCEGNKAWVCLVGDDVAALRQALQHSRMPFEEQELLTEVMENEPGQIASLAQKLSDHGCNLHSLYVLGRDDPLIEVGFTVDDSKRAKKALAE